MPLRGSDSNVIRLVVGERGRVAMRIELVLRFGHGAVVPWATRLEDGTPRAIAGPDMALLRTPVPLRGENLTTVGEFTVGAGETVPFVKVNGSSCCETTRERAGRRDTPCFCHRVDKGAQTA